MLPVVSVCHWMLVVCLWRSLRPQTNVKWSFLLPATASDDVDTEGLEHLLKAAKRGQISMMEEEDER